MEFNLLDMHDKDIELILGLYLTTDDVSFVSVNVRVVAPVLYCAYLRI
jgi:hypothetical protein